MSIGSFDIIAKIRNLLNFGTNTEENSLKRRAENQSDYPSVTKYRRVSNDFPKIIQKPFEEFKDDNLFIRPRVDKCVTMSQRRSDVNSNPTLFTTSRPLVFNPDILFADNEFSDQEDDIIITARHRGSNSLNSSRIKTRRSLLSEENVKSSPREINIPIRIERKPPPPLLKARTGGFLAASCIPNLQPINKNRSLDQMNPPEYTNGFGNHISFNKKMDSVTSFNDTKASKNTRNTSSVISKAFNLVERERFRNLLATVVPNLYNTTSRRSSYLNEKQDTSDQIDLTTSKRKPKVEEVINLDNDEDIHPKDIIDLDDDDVQIISACQKLNRKNYKELPPKIELPRVDPVNTLKDKLDLTPTLQPEWLEKFREKHEEKIRLRKKQIAEEEENVRKCTEETEKAERLIEKKLKNFMIDTETIILDESEPEEEEVEFPELTEDDITLIKRAIHKGPPDEVLICKFNLQITRRDINTLVGDSWLNDEVINFYMNLLIERGEQRHSEGLPRVYAMNTFFIPRLMQSGHTGVRRWTRKVDIFSYDIIPVPVHVGGVHWCMAIIHLRNKTIKYYDSMGTPNPKVLQALEMYLKEEALDKKKQYLDTSDFIKESVRDVPRQMNGSDCGVFSCMFAEYITRNKEITFSQQHMPYFRQKMILEIVQGNLLM